MKTLLLYLFLAVALSACGGGDEEADAPAPPTERVSLCSAGLNDPVPNCNRDRP
jgi:hypothetical protein